MSAEVVDLGASDLDATSGVVWAQCKGAPLDDGDGGADPDYGKAPLMCALGIAARPYPADDRGQAQGVVIPVAGFDAACVAAHDPRSAKVYGEIQGGESAFFATGKDFDSRALAKNQLFAIVVGTDYVVTVDRKAKKIAISCPGGTIQVSEDDGLTLCDATGKGSLRLKGGVAALLGQVVLGGGNPSAPVADATKVMAELAKIALAISTFIPGTGGASFAQPYTAPSDVSAPGVFLGS